VALHEDAAAVGLHQPHDVLERDALARAAPAQQAERPAAADLERHVLEHTMAAKGLRDVLERHDRVAGHQ
jgi:hypothetical protein